MTTAHLICFQVGFLAGSVAMFVLFMIFRLMRQAKHRASIKAAVAKLPK